MATTLVPATISADINSSNIIVLLLLQLGCFFFCSSKPPPTSQQQQLSKTRKISPFSPSVPTPAPTDDVKANNGNGSIARSLLSHLKYILPFCKPQTSTINPATIAAPAGLQWLSPGRNSNMAPNMNMPSPHLVLTKHQSSSYTVRGDIHPCPSCGEVFARAHLLDLHQGTKHALSELADSDSGNNIIRIIFSSGWKTKSDRPLAVRRILRVNNSPKTLARFEEHREIVRARAAARLGTGRVGQSSEEERCMADGNERLRFYCTTYLCGLDRRSPDKEGSGGIGGVLQPQGSCGSSCCGACGIVRHGFWGKAVMGADGVATQGTAWAANLSLPEELEEEFAFMHFRRAMVVCRVVAGRVALGGGSSCYREVETEQHNEEGKGGGGWYYDSMVVSRGGVLGEEELVVFNPKAVLPCFLILYSCGTV